MSTSFPSFGGKIPPIYDQYLGPYIFEPYAVDICRRIADTKGPILELAAGTGRVTKHLSDKFGEKTRLIITDLNPGMLEIARSKIAAASIEWMIADIQDLPFNDQSFDRVICQFGFMFLPDKQKGFNEVYRVLKPGGQLLFNTWDKLENNTTAAISRRVVNSYFPDVSFELLNIPFSLHSPTELKQYLHQAGFSQSEVMKITLTAESPYALDIATGFIGGNPMLYEITNNDPALQESIKQKVAEEIRKEFGDNPVRSELNAWIVEAIK